MPASTKSLYAVLVYSPGSSGTGLSKSGLKSMIRGVVVYKLFTSSGTCRFCFSDFTVMNGPI